jgi:hypothetical protein
VQPLVAPLQEAVLLHRLVEPAGRLAVEPAVELGRVDPHPLRHRVQERERLGRPLPDPLQVDEVVQLRLGQVQEPLESRPVGLELLVDRRAAEQEVPAAEAVGQHEPLLAVDRQEVGLVAELAPSELRPGGEPRLPERRPLPERTAGDDQPAAELGVCGGERPPDRQPGDDRRGHDRVAQVQALLEDRRPRERRPIQRATDERHVLPEGGAVELAADQGAVAEPDRPVEVAAELQPLDPGVLDHLAGPDQLQRLLRGEVHPGRRRLVGLRLRAGDQVVQLGVGHGGVLPRSVS